MMHKLPYALLVVLVIVLVSPVAVIAFNAPTAPPTMASMVTPKSRLLPSLPSPRHFRTRDGSSLQYFAYPAAPDRVAVLVHGSAGPGASMHGIAESLRAAGITAYVLDIRGHGGSGRRGDIDYIGQLDDDLADFVAYLGPPNSGETRTLVGFSAGAGFTIRFAGGPQGLLFDQYIFLAPILPGAPTLRPSAGGWTSIAVPRLVTIAWLDRMGIHWFDGFSVISYAIPPGRSQAMTGSYSYRLMLNFGAGRQSEAYIKNIRRPAVVLVGGADEQVVADQFAPLMERLGVNIPVTIIPNLTHTDMIREPQSFRAIIRAISPQGE